MRNFHLPIWLAPGQPGASAFVALFLIEAIARTVPIAAVPLQAHALFADAQRISVLYFLVSVAGLFGSLTIPWLVYKIRRRWVFTAGAALVIAANLSFALESHASLIAGLLCQIFGTACIEITLNLYVLDHVARRDITHFEPKRIFFAAGAWALGPWAGVALRTHFGPWAAYGIAVGAAVALLLLFWYLRLTDNPLLPRGRTAPPNPVRYSARFFSQPRLRLAWFLAVGRAGWWMMFFVYAPIYAVTIGFGEVGGGAIVSLGATSLFLVPLWSRIAQKVGMRWLLIVGYTLTGSLTIAVAFLGDQPWIGASLIVGAAFAASIVDGAGNTLFLRAVRPLERAEMTTVFGTFRHTAQLAAPGLFAVLLKTFALSAVFAAGGAVLLGLAWFARHIPKKM